MADTTEELIQEVVAGSATWQLWTGAESAAQAQKRVHWPAVDGPDEDELDHSGYTKPFAVVTDVNKVYRSGHGGFRSGSCNILFLADVIEEHRMDHFEAMKAFIVKVDAICAEIMALGRLGGYLDVARLSNLTQPMRETMQNRDFHIYQIWQMDWGLT